MRHLVNTSLHYLIILIIGCSLLISCKTNEAHPISLIIDADSANEVDDLFALASAILEPKFDIKGITSAQFHTSPLASDTTVLESQYINEKILSLLQKTNIPAPIGSNRPMVSKNIPAKSQASQFIIDQAHQLPDEKILHLVILGSCTNVASAIIQDPTIIPKIEVHYLGFWHNPEDNSYDKKEFNSGNDTIAVELLLNTNGLILNVMSATTSQDLIFNKTDVDQHLQGEGGIGDFLVNRWETYQRWWTQEDSEKTKWIMWDVAILEVLARPHLGIKETFTTPSENTKRYINIYTSIEVEEIKKGYWNKLDTFLENNK